MISLPRTAIGIALVACLGLTSCGDKSGKKVARKLKPGDQLIHESWFSDDKHIKDTGKPFTPEQKAFFHSCAKVTFGMSEQEVDGIMSAYPSHPEKKTPDPDQEDDGRYVKLYEEKPDAIEWDYYLHATFDDTHHLVEAYVSEYIK